MKELAPGRGARGDWANKEKGNNQGQHKITTFGEKNNLNDRSKDKDSSAGAEKDNGQGVKKTKGQRWG